MVSDVTAWKRGGWVALLLGLCIPGHAEAQEGETAWVSGSPGAWLLPANAEKGRAHGQEAILLGRGAPAVRQDTEFRSGTIEFDVAPTDDAMFVGVIFRRASEDDYETVYLRPGASGEWDAVQYMPVIKGGSTWQIYPEFNAQADVPRNEWTHVRLEVDGPRARIFVGDVVSPSLVVDRLRGEAGEGSVGFWATDGTERHAAAISNVEVMARPASEQRAEPPASIVQNGMLTAWHVSAPYEPEHDRITWFPEVDAWEEVWSEEGGLVNLTRHAGWSGGTESQTVLARTTLRSDEERVVALDIAYSDAITVFVNGRPVYSGSHGWSSRYPGYLGHVRLGFETAYLPLHEGDNHLVLAVTERQGFGWGFKAKLPEGQHGVWASTSSP